MSKVPLGQRESQVLELKGRDALKDPSKIGREVVGMLNSVEGGEVWIGVREDNGVGVELEPIADAESQRTRLRDHLVDSLEPSPDEREIRAEVVAVDRGVEILRITVRGRDDRKPYALLKSQARLFMTRIEDRLRSMSRDELRKAFTKPSGQPGMGEEVKARLLEEQGKILANRRETFWLAIEPVGRVQANLEAIRASHYLTRPELTGNRLAGSTFAESLVWGEARLDLGRCPARELRFLKVVTMPGEPDEEPAESRLVFWENGGLRWAMPTSSLAMNPLEVEPLRLFELTYSLLRLAGAIYREARFWEGPRPSEGRVNLVITDLQGYKLIPSPRTFVPGRCRFDGDKDFIGQVLHFHPDEILQNPDHCAWRILRDLYTAFGLMTDSMPLEVDPATGRLDLPS